MRKRIIACFLAGLAFLLLLPGRPLRAETEASGTCGENLTWTFDEDGTLTVSGTGKMDDYFPLFASGAAPWIQYSTRITKVVIHKGVTSVGDYAFNNCPITELSLPEGLKRIGEHAFFNTELESVVLPSSLSEISVNSFAACHQLQSITVKKGNKTFSSLEGALYAEDGAKLILCPAGKAEYVFPEGVTAMSAGAFEGCEKIKTITVPEGDPENYDGLQNTYGAFRDCINLEKARFEGKGVFLHCFCFQNCYKLKTVEFSSDLEYGSCDGIEVFNGCRSLKEFIIPPGTDVIGGRSFQGCDSLKTLTIPGSLKKMYEDTFDLSNEITKVFYMGSPADWRALLRNGGIENGFAYPAINVRFYYAEKPTLKNTASGIRLTWKGGEKKTGYYIYRWEEDVWDWVRIGTVKPGKARSFVDKTASSQGEEYRYRIVAYKGICTSEPTEESSIYRLKTPKISSVKRKASGKYTVRWKMQEEVSGYQIKYVVGKTKKTVKVKDPYTTTKVISKLKKGKTYKFYLRSWKKIDGKTYYSNWSKVKKVKIR